MNVVMLVILGGLLVVLLVTSNRNKAKRAAADVERRQAMVPGTRVMTTAGVYGTITAVDPANDGSTADVVTLRVAPGVEVTWALAALRPAPERVTPSPVDTPAPGTDVADVVAAPDGTPGTAAVTMAKPKGRTAAER